MGRPKKDDRRDQVLPLRLNEQESIELDYVANGLGLSRAEVLRQLVNSKYRMLKWYDQR